MESVVSATCDLVAGFGHLMRGNVFYCTQLFKGWVRRKLVKIFFFPSSLLYKLLFLKKIVEGKLCRVGLPKKLPALFIHI